MSRSKQKGTAFERQVADYLAQETGQPIDREPLHGAKDEGDISGATLLGKRLALECKNHREAKLAEWVDEAKAEAGNAGAEWFAVAHKRRGKGDPAEQYVTTTLGQLARMMREGR